SVAAMYTKEQMLEIYKLGAFKSIDFSERFNHVTNATTPELLVPLCLLPMSEEEREMRLNPTVRGGSRWQGEQDVRRGERLSNGSDGINGGLRDPRFTEANVSAIDTCGGGAGAAAGDGVVQGPFPEAQIAEWFSMGYLPADLPMRSSDDPPDQYTPLSVLTRGGSADPPFVAAHRLRLEYEERMRASAVAMSDKAKEREAQEMERVAMERAAQERAMQERLAAERAAQARVFSEAARMRAEEEARARAEAEETRRQLEQQEALHRQHAAQLEAQRQAEAEAHRRMIEEARRKAEEEARREAEEVRRRALEEARRQAEEEAMRHREELQMRLKAEAEQLARRQAEHAEIARRQAEELAMRQAAIEDAHRRQTENEELARRQAEDVARRRAAMEEQQRAFAMLPPAGTPGAGNALLAMLQQSSDSNPARSNLPGMTFAPGQQPVTSSNVSHLFSAAATSQEPTQSTERSRGRGRGVCSAALGTRRPNDSEPAYVGGLNAGMSSMHLHGASEDLTSTDAGNEMAFDGDVDQAFGKKIKHRGVHGDPDRYEDSSTDRAWTGSTPAPVPAPMTAPAAAPSQSPAWGGWPQQQTANGALMNGGRQMTLQQIQEQEEAQRKQKEREAAAAAAAAAAARPAVKAGGVASAWGSGTIPGKPPAAAPPPMTAFATQPAPVQAAPTRVTEPQPSASLDDDGLLFDYRNEAASVVAPSPVAPTSTKKKKKGKGGEESPPAASTSAPPVGDADAGFGLSESGMPPQMAQWCEGQMHALTGADDVTLAHFLYSLQNDDEIHSYLTMYLGESAAVSSFATEFTLRKRAARGTGESVEWKTCFPLVPCCVLCKLG
ncbi:MAG: hypothetical protein SGPRY_003199, partial [Prymnesium sp.]